MFSWKSCRRCSRKFHLAPSKLQVTPRTLSLGANNAFSPGRPRAGINPRLSYYSRTTCVEISISVQLVVMRTTITRKEPLVFESYARSIGRPNRHPPTTIFIGIRFLRNRSVDLNGIGANFVNSRGTDLV